MYSFDLSIVIPVFNSHDYIRNCIQSLVDQTHGFGKIEVLLINDGSVDGSGALCEEYAEKYNNVVYFYQDNAGVSAARNLGIQNAHGKYIFCLDADDWLSPNTVAALFSFFEEHYDEVDLVSCRIINYLNGIETPHPRNALINKTRVYDLNTDMYMAQTNVNVCVKNSKDESILFNRAMSFAEDEERNTRIAMKKAKIGYCHEAVYYYRRHAESATKNEAHRKYTGYFEYFNTVCDKYSDNGRVHPYIQATVLYGINWRFGANMILSDTLSEQEYAHRVQQLKAILCRIEDEVIVNSPFVDPFLALCFLRLKGDELRFFSSAKGFAVCSGSALCSFGNAFEIAVSTICVREKTLRIQGFTKSPTTDFCAPILRYSLNDEKSIDIELAESTRGYINSKTKINTFYAFDIEVPHTGNNTLSFTCELEGEPLPVNMVFGEKSPINRYRNQFIHKGMIIRHQKKPAALFVQRASVWERLRARISMERKNLYIGKKMFILRMLTLLLPKRRIWLYSDRGDLADNACVQFRHDITKKDGIKRYYVARKPKGDPTEIVAGVDKKRLVYFGSVKHKLLYLRCEKILASFLSQSIVSPFPEKSLSLYSDLLRFELVYLQHGVLHAHLPFMYAKERSGADRVVVSTTFEQQNFVEKYGYKPADLIGSGMARYDTMDTEKTPKNAILFCPSWRSDLIGGLINNEREPKLEAFLASPFYKNLMAFLNSPKLANILEEFDLYLDYKNHPIFQVYDEFITVDNPRVRVMCEDVAVDDYLLMITDYSSVVFDFVYLDRPILYFVPDYDYFKAGVSHNYSSLDLPLEDGFGEFTQTASELLIALEKLVRNKFVPEDKYLTRGRNFFIHKDKHNAERLYQVLASERESS